MSQNLSQNILIVDDSATTRAMITRVIGMTGLAVGPVLEAADGKAALAIMESTPVDLVLADLNMPVMDGAQMIAAMRRSPELRNIHVVVISAQPDPELIEQLKRDGVAGYLAKPFTPESMSSLIGPLLESRRQIEVPVLESPGSFNLTLAEALVEALETMAFISPELPEKQDRTLPTPDLRVVHVEFHGDRIDGTLSLAASAQFGQLVAVNCAAADTPAAGDDALKELANITCGLLLRKRLGSGVGFKMTPPVMGQPDEIDQWFNGKDVVCVNADGYLLTSHVTTHATSDESLLAMEAIHQ